MSSLRSVIGALFLLALAPGALAQAVVIDGDISLSETELRFLVNTWTPQMREAAANDMGDRLELINKSLISKKLAAEYDKQPPAEDSKGYWRNEMNVRNAKYRAQISSFRSGIEVPDMTELARELYRTERYKYAFVPEQRLTSHILLRCKGRECLAEEMQGRAQQVLERLNGGEDFAALAAELSEDPGSKKVGGKFDRWMSPGQEGVAKEYRDGAFTIENTGDYSEPVHSQFGLHIIRLDEVRPSYYKPFEEVKPAILAELEGDYRNKALRVYVDQFNLSDELKLDVETLDEIFAPYKTLEAQEQPGSESEG